MKAANPQKTGATVRFTAELVADGGADGMHLALPTEAGLSSAAGLAIEGTMAGFPFRAPLKSGAIEISDAIAKACGAHLGDAVTVEVTRIGDAPEVLVPEDLQHALDESPDANALWQVVTPMARREWVRWIASAKQQETRERRIEVGVDKLKKGMRRPCCFPGLNFVTKGLVPPEDTWAALPGKDGNRPTG